MADFSVIVRTLKRAGIDREYLDEAYERGFLTDEELKN